jgi:hypothetical protein
MDAQIDEFEYDLTRKAAAYLRFTFGVRLPNTGVSIRLPARPHATTNPALEEAILDRLTRAVSASF